MKKLHRQKTVHAKSKKLRRSALALAVSSALYAQTLRVNAEVPIPCAGGSCVGGGRASHTLPVISELNGLTKNDDLLQWTNEQTTISKKIAADKTEQLLIEQFTDKALYQWDSFDIAEGNKVVFSQLDSSSVAINQILDVYPSEIFGSLQANGQIYLFNRAGIIFGPESQINVGTLLASSLEVPDVDGEGLVDKQDYAKLLGNKGLLAYFEEEGITEFGKGQMPALVNRESTYEVALPETYGDVLGPNGEAFVKGGIWVNKNAVIKTKEYGKVMLFGSEIVNAGLISTPNGQAILAAAKDQAWIEPVGGDFIVNVKGGGVVSNLGEIIAEKGNVDLIGMAVNQQGLIRATTSIDFNGSIELRAEDTVLMRENPIPSRRAQAIFGDKGQITLGEKSKIVIDLDVNNSATAIDSQEHKQSTIDIVGAHIFFGEDSQLIAKNGHINVFADIPNLSDTSESASIEVAENVRFDVSGADSVLSVDSLVAEVTLTGNELADFPVQKQGELKGKTIRFDTRKVVKTKYANGDERYLLPFADVTGVMQTREKNLSQRASDAGSVTFDAQMGDITFADSVSLDVSAGITTYTSGVMNTTLLVDQFGAVVPVAEANGNIAYQGTVSDFNREVQKWGVQQKWSVPWDTKASYELGYKSYEGALAGELSVIASHSIKGLNDIVLDVRQVGTELERGVALPGATLNIGGVFTHDSLTEGELSLGSPSIRLVNQDIYSEVVANSRSQRMTDTLLEFDAQSQEAADSVDTTVYITPEYIKKNNISQLNLSSNSEISIAENTVLELPAFGGVSTNSPSLSVMGSVIAPSGSVVFGFNRPDNSLVGISQNTRDYYMIFDGATIDVSGLWSNDLLDDAVMPISKRVLDGGSIDVTWAGERAKNLLFSGENTFKASAGAWLDRDAKLTGGEGGSINLSLGNSADEIDSRLLATADAKVTIEAYGYRNGGDLTLQLPEIHFDEGDSESLAFEFSESENGINQLLPSAKPALLNIESAFFTANGIADFNIINSFSDFIIKEEQQYDFVQKNYVLNFPGIETLPSASELPTKVAILDAFFRKPVNLTLQVDNDFNTQGYVLALEKNVVLNFDPNANVILNNNAAGGVFVNAEITSPSGRIIVSSKGVVSSSSFNADDGLLWLGDQSLLDVSGGSVRDPRPQSYPSVVYSSGGDVQLNAAGYLVVVGGKIDVSGTAGEATTQGYLPFGTYNPSNNTSTGIFGTDAGSVSLSGAEGVTQNGEMFAAAGSDKNVGGELSIIINPTKRSTDTFGKALGPELPRRIVITDRVAVQETEEPALIDDLANSGLSDNPSVSDNNETSLDDVSNHAVDTGVRFSAIALENGKALTSREAIEVAQFAKVNLSTGVDSKGSIDFGSGEAETNALSLALQESLVIETGVVNVRSDTSLSAPYIKLSGGAASEAQVKPGESRLTLSANYLSRENLGLIDVDRTRIAGVNELILQTSGDVRFTSDVVATGSVTVDARQLYPVTNTSANLALSTGVKALSIALEAESELDEPEILPGRIFVLSNHYDSDLPPLYSAGGNFELTSDEIFINGVIRSPFGRISLDADKLVFESQAYVSVSADNVTIPFSPILSGIAAAVYPKDAKVEIKAATIDMRKGASIDLSGGGDLINWGFVRSSNGSQDILSPSVSPNTYAIIPGQDIAPINATIASLSVGRQVTLAEGGGLSAGTYTLLPARYALLEDAWLVTLEPSFSDLVPGVNAQLLDGTPVVSGYFSTGLHFARDQQFSGFSLRKNSELQQYSEYQIVRASNLDNAGATLWHPENAGSFQVVAKAKLNLSGAVIGDFSSGAFGSRVSISADKLRVSTERNVSQESLDYVELLDSELAQMNASSLLLGGKRVRDGLSESIVSESESVEVMDGAFLTGSEILLTASQKIQIGKADLSNLKSSPASDSVMLNLANDGAILGISNRKISQITRDIEASQDELGKIQIFVDDSANIVSENSLIIDSQYGVDLQNAVLKAKRVILGAERISLGEAPEDIQGLKLSNTNIQSLGSAEALILNSLNAIDFYGDTKISGDSLALSFQSSGLHNQSEGNSQISVDTFSISGPSDPVAETPLVDPGGDQTASDGAQPVFDLNAKTIYLGDGNFDINGWDSFSAQADTLLLDGDGELNLENINQSDISVGLVSALQSGNIKINADALTLSRKQDASYEQRLGLGGVFEVSADVFTFDTQLSMASGRIDFTSRNGDLVLGNNASIDLSGVSKTFYNTVADTWGGKISLVSSGDIVMETGASIDISGAGKQSGGDMTLRAGLQNAQQNMSQGSISIGGQLVGAISTNKIGANIVVSAKKISNASGLDGFTEFNEKLNNAGFSHSRQFQITQGDLLVAEDAVVESEKVQIAVDQGSLTVNGVITSGAAKTGIIELVSQGDLIVNQSAQLLATGSVDNGGKITLSSYKDYQYDESDLAQHQGILIADAATIDVSGAKGGGVVHLNARTNAESSAIENDINVWLLDSENTTSSFENIFKGADEVVLGGIKLVELGDSSDNVPHKLGSEIVSHLQSAKEFVDAASHFDTEAGNLNHNLWNKLGLDATSDIQIIPDVEFWVNDDAVLKTNGRINFSSQADTGSGRFTVRTTGDLVIDQTMDYELSEKDSWSYTFATTGLDSIVPWGVSHDGGVLSLTQNSVILSGTGDIALYSSSDINLKGRVSTIGKDTGRDRIDTLNAGEQILGEAGGNITLIARGEIEGNAGLFKSPFFTDGTEYLVEQFREGRKIVTTGSNAYRMAAPSASGGTTFNITSLAGGDIDIRSGGSITELSAGGFTALTIEQGEIDQHVGIGDVYIESAKNIDSALLMVGDGHAEVFAGGDMDSSFSYQQGKNQAYSLFGLQGGSINTRVLGDITFAGVVNSTLPKALTYGSNSALALSSLAGDIHINAKALEPKDFNFVGSQVANLIQWLPGRFSSTSFQGDVNVAPGSNLFLSPSVNSKLEIRAENNVTIGGEDRFGSPVPATIFMSELDPESIPFLSSPNDKFRLTAQTGRIFTTVSDDSELQILPERVLQYVNNERSSIIALTGNYDSRSGGNDDTNIIIPNQLTIFAGQDIIEPKLSIKHGRSEAISKVIAQGSISDVHIEIEGPGRLDVAAGNDITFVVEKSGVQGAGITSLGGSQDSRLAGEGGADINVFAGISPEDMAWDSYIEPYLTTSDSWDDFVHDMRIFVDQVSQKLNNSELKQVSSLTDYEVLQRYLEIPQDKVSSFTSQSFENKEERDALVAGFSFSIEMASLLSRSNYGSELSDQFFDETSGSYEALKKLFVDSIRVFRDTEFYQDYYSDGSQPEVLTQAHIIKRVEETGLVASEYSSQINFYNIFSEESKRKVIERSFLLLSSSEQRRFAADAFTGLSSEQQQELILGGFFSQLRDAGRLSNKIGNAGYDLGFQAIQSLFPKVSYLGDMKLESGYHGNLSMDLRRIYTFDGGDINIVVPGGEVNAGDPSLAVSTFADATGVVAVKEGDVRSFTHDGFLVNQSRIQTLGGGNILMWATEGDLDAGRGARTALSAPAPEISIGDKGQVIVNLGAAISGSGIRQVNVLSTESVFNTDPNNVKPAKGIDLVAPNGSVDAGEAGIFASGNLNVAAARVLNSEFIEVGGSSDGVPSGGDEVVVPAVTDDVAALVSKDISEKVEKSAGPDENPLSWLEVDVLGFGDDCDESIEDCD